MQLANIRGINMIVQVIQGYIRDTCRASICIGHVRALWDHGIFNLGA